MLGRAFAGLVISVFTLASANAATIQSVTMSKKDGSYIAEAEFIVNVPLREVTQAFTDFDRLSELNPAISYSHSQITADGSTQVTTRLRDCIAFFCKSVTLIENIRIDEAGNLFTEVEPDDSDFLGGNAAWIFEARGTQTRVSYRSEMQPNFWVPPLLGRRAMRNALRRQIEASVAKLEASN